MAVNVWGPNSSPLSISASSDRNGAAQCLSPTHLQAESLAYPKQLTLASLPPLPEPNTRERRKQLAGGIAIVSFLILICNLTTLLIFFLDPKISLTFRFILLGLTVLESVVAIICLVFIGLSDPGVIKRSDKTCWPLPAVVSIRLRAGEPLDGMANVSEEKLEARTFCVRCLVWRSHGSHHCATCQRCVSDFDHHCAVLGRCIAGRGCSGGNLRYFQGLVSMGFLGGLTAVGAAGWALSLWVGWWALVIIVAAYCLVQPSCAVLCFCLRYVPRHEHCRRECCGVEHQNMPTLNLDWDAFDSQDMQEMV
eukprot:gb/GEZN01011047.1/.p1 GENE.gb/GEZN01011047.1/~~gb/GEZN01011047.1/.p1  ORF type:complete len:308 (-),score=18.59 gb/GEZN01011047.1/:241-1164(-)